ncbi:hypothetical protein EEL30_12085 [Brevibacillus laterosporus]|uniref:DNA alkylation repair protein n=1 Tax=Brevibacillus laterosporus TaxID=1465 RepID=A0A518V7N7_BRELA|nr:hypothetical protein EEL30_12085 [Brevibacillus laterosporus]
MESKRSLADLIRIYNEKMKTVARGEGQKIRKSFGEQVRELTHEDVEKDIISYIKESLVTKQWKNAHEWIGSALDHPSSQYIDYFLKILNEQDSNAPHYWALDVIEYMPEIISETAIPQLKKLAENINPTWSEAVIEKYFETIVWNDENAEEFISTLVNSSNEKISFRAKYWMETFEVERKEDAEDD